MKGTDNGLRERVLQFLDRNHAGVLLKFTDNTHRKSDFAIVREWWERELALLLASEAYQLALLTLNHTIFTRIVILEWKNGRRTCTLAVTARGISYAGCTGRTPDDSIVSTATSIANDMTSSTSVTPPTFAKKFADARALLEASLVREMITYDIARDAERFTKRA